MTVNKAFVFTLFFTVLFYSGVAGAQQKLDAVAEDRFFNQLEATLGQVKTLFHPFEQTRHVDLFSEDVTARGVTLFVAPDKIRHEITAPFQTVLISSRDGLARYEKTAGQEWKKLTGGAVNAMSQVTSQIALWLQGQVRASNKQYKLEVYRLAEGYQIKMVPINNMMRKNISWIELRLPLNCTQVSSVTMHEASGDYTRIDYSAFQPVDKAIPEAVFAISGAGPTTLPAW